MKSSTLIYIIVFGFITLPILFWVTTMGEYDVRSRADEASASATLSPTPKNQPPVCNGLSVSPNAGSKPLTVNFSCAGYDSDNDITAAEFGFGGNEKRLVEKNIGQFGAISTSFTYTASGTYRVTCRVRDNNQSFSSHPEYCQYYVYVSENALTPTPIASPTPKRLPTSSEPIIYIGNIPSSTPTAVTTPTPTLAPYSPQTGPWIASDKLMQLVMMVVVSGVTIIVALLLHGFFDKR